MSATNERFPERGGGLKASRNSGPGLAAGSSPTCHVCGAKQIITTTVVAAINGRKLEGILHCSANPAHDVGEPFLRRVLDALAYGPVVLSTPSDHGTIQIPDAGDIVL